MVERMKSAEIRRICDGEPEHLAGVENRNRLVTTGRFSWHTGRQFRCEDHPPEIDLLSSKMCGSPRLHRFFSGLGIKLAVRIMSSQILIVSSFLNFGRT